MSGIFSSRAWGKIWLYRGTFLLGLVNTLETAFISLIIALTLGIIFGLMATNGKKVLVAVSRVYVEIIQNTPILLQLCFLYYALAFAGRSPGIFITGFIALGVYTGAYMSEVIRSGIQSIPKGQFEAAAAQGFGYFGKMYHIILPQSIKVILPPMVTTIVNMIKNTSCLYIVGGADLLSLTYSFVTGENTGGSYAPAYILCGAMFFLMCFPLSTLASMWETSLKRRDRRVNVAKAETVVKAEEEAV